jgi:UDP-N-acetylglucosamine--N-acetylmuramyl-(pentapeptide) pyrophosphoryl-undecaprenol N-acetylglucosamine transferase
VEPITSSGIFAMFAGGGTAGHLLPGLVVANTLVERGHPPASITFLASEGDLDRRLVEQWGFAIHALPGRGIQRRFTLENLAAALGLVRGVVRGVRVVRHLRPQVMVVLGGFASVPGVIGAVLWRVPMVVLEQNARAGAANRLAGLFAKAAAVPFPETDLPRRVVTGNPVRPEVLAAGAATGARRDAARVALDLPPGRTVLAVFSGSLGARRINQAVRAAVQQWRDRSDLAVHHVVGSRDYDQIVAEPFELPAEGIAYRAVRYEDHMDDLLLAADVAVCRAGGSTVAELAEVALPALLVPLPIAPRDHQTANARALVGVGAAVLVPDGELDGARVVRELEPLLADPERRARMSTAAAELRHPDAAARVADLIEEHARG